MEGQGWSSPGERVGVLVWCSGLEPAQLHPQGGICAVLAKEQREESSTKAGTQSCVLGMVGMVIPGHPWLGTALFVLPWELFQPEDPGNRVTELRMSRQVLKPGSVCSQMFSSTSTKPGVFPSSAR